MTPKKVLSAVSQRCPRHCAPVVQTGSSWFHDCSYWRLPFSVSPPTLPPSYPPTPIRVSLGCLPNKLLAPEFLSPGRLLGEPKLRQQFAPTPMKVIMVCRHWHLCPWPSYVHSVSSKPAQCLACSRCSTNDPKLPSPGGQVVLGTLPPLGSSEAPSWRVTCRRGDDSS